LGTDIRPEGFDSKFLLAMVCINQSQQRSAWQLGLSWLHELMNNEVSRKKIQELYSFLYIDFINISTKCDVYMVRALLSTHDNDDHSSYSTTPQPNSFTEISRINDIMEKVKWLELQLEPWEKNSEEQKQYISELSSHMNEITDGNTWLESQRDRWKILADEYQEKITELTRQLEELKKT